MNSRMIEDGYKLIDAGPLIRIAGKIRAGLRLDSLPNVWVHPANHVPRFHVPPHPDHRGWGYHIDNVLTLAERARDVVFRSSDCPHMFDVVYFGTVLACERPGAFPGR